MKVQSTALYGNSTDFMYYYLTVFVGSHRQPQTLIIDTGSSLAAIPCKQFCSDKSCGDHINEHYDNEQSTSFYMYDCNSVKCVCTDGHKCRFYQGYAEGSLYDGYVVSDQLYFGENYHLYEDAFQYTFGCVKRETKYFYSQDVDGILGLSQDKPAENMNRFEAIYDVMHEQNIIEKREFGICLGKDGGYFQVGGYDKQGFLEDDVSWVPILRRNDDFKISLSGMMINNHYMAGSEKIKVGFVDSGTTFTYISTYIYNIIKTHFEWFCNLDKENHCKGVMDFKRKGYLCFSYDEDKFPEGPIRYFMSFPVFRILMSQGKDSQGQDKVYYFNWYASEYMYRESDNRYCMAIDLSESTYITIGGTMMRQHYFLFDVDNN